MTLVQKVLIGVGLLVAIALGMNYPSATNVVERIKEVGAQSVAVTDGDCFFFEGFHRCQKKVVMTVATTTVCAIKSPNATSTLAFGSAEFSVSSSTASTVTIAKATTAFATTTLLGSRVVLAANAQGTVVATTTAAQLNTQDNVFAPNTWLVVGMSGGNGTFSPTGNCAAEFIY